MCGRFLLLFNGDYVSLQECSCEAWPCQPPFNDPATFLAGPKAFYKGATARLARVCLDVTVIMVLYEQINKVLDKVWVTE